MGVVYLRLLNRKYNTYCNKTKKRRKSFKLWVSLRLLAMKYWHNGLHRTAVQNIQGAYNAPTELILDWSRGPDSERDAGLNFSGSLTNKMRGK